MKKISDYEVLNVINRYSSVISLLRAGYWYLDVYQVLGKLENDGAVIRRDDGAIILSAKGKEKLEILREKLKMPSQKIEILPLYRTQKGKNNLDDVYLP